MKKKSLSFVVTSIIAIALNLSAAQAETTQTKLISASLECIYGENITLLLSDNTFQTKFTMDKLCPTTSASSEQESYKLLDFQGDLRQGYALIHHYVPGNIGKYLQFIRYQEGNGITALSEIRYVDWHPYFSGAVCDLLDYKISNNQLLLVFRGYGNYLPDQDTDTECPHCFENRINVFSFKDERSSIKTDRYIYYQTDTLFKDYPEFFTINQIFREASYVGYEYMDEFSAAGHIFETADHYPVQSEIDGDSIVLRMEKNDQVLTLYINSSFEAIPSSPPSETSSRDIANLAKSPEDTSATNSEPSPTIEQVNDGDLSQEETNFTDTEQNQSKRRIKVIKLHNTTARFEYKLADGAYYIPGTISALMYNMFITPSGYLYEVYGLQGSILKFRLLKKVLESEVNSFLVKGAVLAVKAELP